MPIVSSAQLAQLRERPQSTRLYLSIYEPATVLAAKITTGSPVPGDEYIYYDTVSVGGYAQVVEGMTLLVGTYAGAFDKGRIRVREATSGYIKVAPNQDINWQVGDYLTVLAFHEVWSKYAKISLVLDADDDIILSMDGDITYTNQNNIMGSLMVMGGNYAGFTDTPVYYSASGTYNVLGDTNSFVWKFEGGTPTGSNVMEPGNVSYTTPGHYTTTLEVRDSSNNLTDVGYRHISIYDRFANKPIQQWELTGFSGSRAGGGYQVSIKVRDQITNLLEGSLVVIFSESIHGSTSGEIGGNSKNRSSIIFSGYISEGSISYDYEESSIDFRAVSTTDIMKNRDGMSQSVDSVTTPTKWQQLPDLNIKKAIYHYLKWHSTVTEVTDIRYIGYDHPVQYLETDMESIYDGLQSYLENRIDGLMVSDRQNTLFIESGIRICNTPTITYPVNMSIDKQDWVESPSIDFIGTPPVSYVDLGGFYYTSVSGTSTPLLAEAPGSLKGYTGAPASGPQGLILLTQEELNQMAGDYYAYSNSRYPNVTIKFGNAFLNLDIAPYEQCLLNIQAADTNRGIIFTDKPFHITELSWDYDPISMTFLPEASFHEITSGFPGTTIPVVIPTYVYPPPESWEDYPIDWTDFPFPDWNFPPTSGRWGWSFIANTISTGIVGMIQVPFNCMIDTVILVTKPGTAGSLVMDIWKCGFGDIVTGTHPVDADSICGATPPTLVSSDKAIIDTASWTLQLFAGDWLFFNIDSISGIDLFTLAISGTI